MTSQEIVDKFEIAQLKAQLDEALELLHLASEAMCDGCGASNYGMSDKCDCELKGRIITALERRSREVSHAQKEARD